MNVPRSPSSESHSAAFSADDELACSSVSAGADSPATFAWRRLAASPPRSSAAGTCLASDSTSARTSSSVWCSVSVARTPECFIGTAGNAPRFVYIPSS